MVKTLDESAIKLALVEIFGGTPKFALSSPKLIKLESAGPNAIKSAWGASIDAIAFFDHPWTLFYYLKYMWYQSSY